MKTLYPRADNSRFNPRKYPVAHSESSSFPPTIGTNSYVYDRVQRIEVFHEIPEQFTEVSNMDGWRRMVRAEAYSQLFDQISADQLFTVECRPLEKEESTPDGKRRLFVGCELRFTRNK